MNILKANPRVCLEFSILGEIVQDGTTCKWRQVFASLIAFGEARVVEDEREKRAGLDAIMAHYDGPQDEYLANKLEVTVVIAVAIKAMIDKRSS